MIAAAKIWFRRGWPVVFLLACYAVLLNQGLNEPDEGRYAEIAREMVAGGDWFTPHQNGIPHFQKPPLLYWVTALSIKTFGVSAWAARFPSLLAALGSLAAATWLAQMLFGRECRMATMLVLGASVGFYVLARLLTPDMMLTFWITAAIAFAVRRNLGGHQAWGYACFVAMGLGFMTKGPLAVIVPLCAVIGMRRAMPHYWRPNFPWLLGLVLTLGIGLWWFVAQSLTDGRLFQYFTGNELVARFASSRHGRSKPIWFFFTVLPVAFLPWTFLLPRLLRDLWDRLRERTSISPREGLLVGWIVPPLLVISFSGSKLPTYILPLLPPLALALVGWWRERGEKTILLRRLGIGMLVLLVALAGLREAINPYLRQQASTTKLAALVRSQSDFEEATIFAARVRAQGFTFGVERLINATEDEADIVVPLTGEQRPRIFKSVAKLEEAVAAEPVVYGIARSGDVLKYFPSSRWVELGRAGDFVLLKRSQ